MLKLVILLMKVFILKLVIPVEYQQSISNNVIHLSSIDSVDDTSAADYELNMSVESIENWSELEELLIANHLSSSRFLFSSINIKIHILFILLSINIIYYYFTFLNVFFTQFYFNSIVLSVNKNE